MAKQKKKKYRIKLNNKIREYFGGLPFDEGVATLDTTTLSELSMLLDIPSDFDDEEIVRSLRRIWSEGDIGAREMIVSYLTGYAKALKGQKRSRVATDTVEKILSILDHIPHEKYEEDLILEHFITQNPSKITFEKIENKLNYLRRKHRIEKIEQALEVTFNTLGEIEFTHSFFFALHRYDFRKLLLCVSDPVDTESLWDSDDQAVLETVKGIKETAAQKMQEAIDAFCTKLCRKKHRYLDEEEIYHALKSLDVNTPFTQAPLPLQTLERIVTQTDDACRIRENGNEIDIQKQFAYELFDTQLRYTASVSYEKGFIYRMIWEEKTLPIREDLLEINDTLIAHFKLTIDELISQMRQQAKKLSLDESDLYTFLLRFLKPHLNTTSQLKIKEKLKRRILYHFGEHIRPLLEKQKREELLAKTIRDFKMLFPLARSLRRKIVFHVGPTNSGKTYQALRHLKNATTGYYLAPLRLLALEGYEKLKEEGIRVSLITGEEEIIDEDSTHVSSTIEMMNHAVDVDVCVIDEIQMIADRDRGWAWANALIGAPAKEVILTGSEDALEIVTSLCNYLDEPLEVVRFERKNPLKMMRRHTPLHRIEPQTAVVAFSRKEVLMLKQALSRYHDVSVVYGNLSPEVRREEARRFRQGESQVLVATDAIAMGLNLPIKTILFAKDNKFDGIKRRTLRPTEVLQIAGRAGRYGFEEEGYVGALDGATLQTIDRAFHTPLETITPPVSVMASLEHVLLIGEILESEKLSEILTFFAQNMEFEGPFVAANIESMLEVAAIVDEYELDLRTRYHLSCAPAGISSPYIESTLHRYIRNLEANKPVRYKAPRELPPFALTNEALLQAEDRVREISLYLWLSFKFPDMFPDTRQAIEARKQLNDFIERSLRKGNFTKRCRKCNVELDLSYRYGICDKCYARKKYGNKPKRTRKRPKSIPL